MIYVDVVHASHPGNVHNRTLAAGLDVCLADFAFVLPASENSRTRPSESETKSLSPTARCSSDCSNCRMYRLRRRDSLCPTRKLPSPSNQPNHAFARIFETINIIAAALDVHLSAAAAQAVDNPSGFETPNRSAKRCSHNPCSRVRAIEMLIAAGDCMTFRAIVQAVWRFLSICASLIVTLVDPPSAYTSATVVDLLNSLLLFRRSTIFDLSWRILPSELRNSSRTSSDSTYAAPRVSLCAAFQFVRIFFCRRHVGDSARASSFPSSRSALMCRRRR